MAIGMLVQHSMSSGASAEQNVALAGVPPLSDRAFHESASLSSPPEVRTGQALLWLRPGWRESEEDRVIDIDGCASRSKDGLSDQCYALGDHFCNGDASLDSHAVCSPEKEDEEEGAQGIEELPCPRQEGGLPEGTMPLPSPGGVPFEDPEAGEDLSPNGGRVLGNAQQKRVSARGVGGLGLGPEDENLPSQPEEAPVVALMGKGRSKRRAWFKGRPFVEKPPSPAAPKSAPSQQFFSSSMVKVAHGGHDTHPRGILKRPRRVHSCGARNASEEERAMRELVAEVRSLRRLVQGTEEDKRARSRQGLGEAVLRRFKSERCGGDDSRAHSKRVTFAL